MRTFYWIQKPTSNESFINGSVDACVSELVRLAIKGPI